MVDSDIAISRVKKLYIFIALLGIRHGFMTYCRGGYQKGLNHSKLTCLRFSTRL